MERIEENGKLVIISLEKSIQLKKEYKPTLNKVSNKIYLQNKYIRNDKELLEILKLILNKLKNKKKSKKQQNEKYKHQEHRNEKQGAVSSDIISEVNNYTKKINEITDNGI